MQKLSDYKRVFDVELTNRCNALCTFCPRDETPDQGFMTFETFKKALERAQELRTLPDINSTGQGEPLLHQDITEFARYAKSLGLPYGMTTNGALLTEDIAEQLIDAGMHRINFSVSDMDEDYEEVYALKFDVTRQNILTFLDINESRGKPVKTMVNIVQHDLNDGKIGKYRRFWLDAGIDDFLYFKQNNRGGACENGHYFIGNDRYREEAARLMADNGISRICSIPHLFVFVGWNGQYYICCNDYKKTSPLGSVFDFSIEEMDKIKRTRYCSAEGIEACENCNMDPINEVRERLFEIEAGDAQLGDLEDLLQKMKSSQAELPDYVRPL